MLVRSRDSVVYSLVVRPRGRIPASEGCLVKRIAGPGLNTEFHYQVYFICIHSFAYIHLHLLLVVSFQVIEFLYRGYRFRKNKL